MHNKYKLKNMWIENAEKRIDISRNHYHWYTKMRRIEPEDYGH